MAIPTINNLVVPTDCILVLPDSPITTTRTGVIAKRSLCGGGHYLSRSEDKPLENKREFERILFVREMATEVKVDGVTYLAMHQRAVVGLIPD